MVEVDNATHPLGRFVTRKVKPALKFVGSRDYQHIFGVPNGAYFVITTGEKRLSNLKEKTEEAGGKGRFYFTTFDQIEKDVLTSSIWQLAGSDEMLSIEDMPLEPRLKGTIEYAPQGQIPIPALSV